MSTDFKLKLKIGDEMKRIFLIALCCLFWFSPRTFAFNLPALTQVVPFEHNGTIYTDYIEFLGEYPYVVYCPNSDGFIIGMTNNITYGYTAPYYISFYNPGCKTPNGLQYQQRYSDGAWRDNSDSMKYLNFIQPLFDTIATTQDVVNTSNSITMNSNFSAYGFSGAYYFEKNAILIPAGNNIAPAPQLTVNISPLEDGSVTIGSYTCDSSNSPCQYPVSEVGQMLPEATANTDYAFGGWIETENPHPLSLNGFSGSQEITAIFYKTFRDATDPEGDGFTYDIDDTGGECVIYVRNETGIDYDACNGPAVNCLGLAQKSGYATGTKPVVGAIAVFPRNASNMPDGHVAIVKTINSTSSITFRHSNWCSPATCHTVSENTLDVSQTPVLGYIYPKP